MLDYLDVAIINAVRQIIGGFGIIFLLSFFMWTLGQRRRGLGGGWFGNTYYYIVAPGVMFHELGHAIGCVITGTPIRRASLFWPRGDRLGYVAYAMPVNARFAAVRMFIISTGPVWLGCIVIALLGRLMAGSEFWPNYTESFGGGSPGLLEYCQQALFAALHMLMSIVSVWRWSSPFYIILLYLLFCVTSEITLSPIDLSGMWRGGFIIVFFLILINLIPGTNWLALKLSVWLAPCLFTIHSVLLLVLMIDFAFFIVLGSLFKCFGK